MVITNKMKHKISEFLNVSFFKCGNCSHYDI